MTLAVVRYGVLRQLVELELPAPDAVRPGQRCVLETPRGHELGVVLALGAGRTGPRGARFVRPGEPADLERARELARRVEADDLPLARESAMRTTPAVRLLAGERPLGGERLYLYYAARAVVDMPTLLRSLHEVLDSEVRLEQLGARKRARACGGAGVCGRTLCCSTFLRRMQPVTMRMAKVQGLSLAPEVTAGVCGRLKCCLRYENPLYEEHHQGLPREGWRVLARRGEGTVVAVDVLRRQVLVRPDADEPGPSLRLFADEILETRPPRRATLPLAGETPPPVAETPPEEEEPVERGWSSLARRLWRRMTPRPPRPDGGGEAPEPEEGG